MAKKAAHACEAKLLRTSNSMEGKIEARGNPRAASGSILDRVPWTWYLHAHECILIPLTGFAEIKQEYTEPNELKHTERNPIIGPWTGPT